VTTSLIAPRKQHEMKIKQWKSRRLQRLLNAVLDHENPIKLAIKAEEAEMQAWLAENRELDTAPLITIWKAQTAQVKDQITNLILRAHSFADGIVKANDALRHGLKIDDGADLPEAVDLLDKIFKIELANLYIASSSCSAEQKSMIVEKLINREFPPKDPVVPKSLSIVRGNMPPPMQRPPAAPGKALPRPR